MEPDHTKKHRGSEKLWLDAAFSLLKESGVEAVKVMPLARRLGLSRTSFYWHFKDRDSLLEAIIRRWENQNTGNLIARTCAPAASISEAMFNLFDCWLDEGLFDGSLDLAIRNWARNNSTLQKRLDHEDRRRCEAVTAMYRRFGFSEPQARARSMTVIYTQIGYLSMQVIENWQERISRMPDYVEVYTGSSPTKAEIARFLARHENREPNPAWK